MDAYKKNREPTIYVAGPMRGYDNYNYPAFDYRSGKLKEMGWEVINPAELDRNQGKPLSDPKAFCPDSNYEDHQYMRSALKRDMDAICDKCTAVYMMANWEQSRGAKAEWHLAKALGLDIFYEIPLPEVSDYGGC